MITALVCKAQSNCWQCVSAVLRMQVHSLYAEVDAQSVCVCNAVDVDAVLCILTVLSMQMQSLCAGSAMHVDAQSGWCERYRCRGNIYFPTSGFQYIYILGFVYALPCLPLFSRAVILLYAPILFFAFFCFLLCVFPVFF